MINHEIASAILALVLLIIILSFPLRKKRK